MKLLTSTHKRKFLNLVLSLWVCVFAIRLPLPATGQSIYTPYGFTNFAGLPGAFGTNDGLGSAARFNRPFGVAVDRAGNVYVGDSGNATIRKLTPHGAVTTLAGNAGQSGTEDGTGSAARFNQPFGVAVDRAGNVYVADVSNQTVRKITPAGVVTTLAGSAGQIGSVDGVGSAARFYSPDGVAVDTAGNVYVTDQGNHTIRMITPAGAVTTLAGSPGQIGSADGEGSTARFYYPSGLAIDSTGNVYVSDYLNATVRKLTSVGSNWVVTTLAGTAGQYGSADGSGSAAKFYAPVGIAVDRAGNVYVAENFNNTIRRITSAGAVTTLAGSAGQSGSTDGTGSVARFSYPYGVALDSAGSIYVADLANSRITKGTPLNDESVAAGQLVVLVDDANLENEQPLLALLIAAKSSFDIGDTIAGINQLKAFQNKVRAQIVPNNGALADAFIRAAQEIIDRFVTNVRRTFVVQPGPTTGKDIWTTSVYSYAPDGSVPGGGLNDERLRVGGWGDEYYSLLQFDLTGLPVNARSAILQVYCFNQNGGGTTMYLDRITQFWNWQTQGTGRDRERLWWADRPAATQWIAGQIPNPIQGQWYSVDITSLYNAWQNGTFPNYGLQFRPVNFFNNNFNEFRSSDYLGDPSLRPKLIIER